jgi:amino acid transporter
MADNFQTTQVPAALRQIATTMRLTGWVTFWIQLVLAVISSLIFLFAVVLSRGVAQGGEINNPGTGGGVFFAVCALIALYFNVYQSFRYTRLARRLKEPDPNLRPKKADTIKLLRFGLIVSFVGMFLAILGAEAITGTLLGKSLAQPQALYNPAINLRDFIQPLDIFVVLANTHTIAAHFAGIGGGLWLLNRLDR